MTLDSSTVAALPKGTAELTPLMQQYQSLKSRHPQEILFFHLGDFYELFADDAKRAAPILEVTLTHRQEVPMCGVPVHAVNAYIAKLLKAGLRVAIADQMEDPSAAKGLVKRDVVRVITAGTLQEESLLTAKQSNFLTSLSRVKDRMGFAAVECSTGEFIATELPAEPISRWWDEVIRLAPSEIVLAAGPQNTDLKQRLEQQGIAVAELPSIDFSPALAEERLQQQFQTKSVRGFGLEGKTAALSAAGALARYLENTQCGRPVLLRPLHTYSLNDSLLMDANTLAHLELQKEAPPGTSLKTLLEVIDQTLSPMGGRLLRRRLVAPLKNISAIQERLNQVDFFFEHTEIRRQHRAILQGWPDMERILARVTARTASPRDLSALGQSLRRVPRLKSQLAMAYQQVTTLNTPCPTGLEKILTQFPDAPTLAELLEKALVETPPPNTRAGGVIREGYHAELDEVRGWIHEGKNRLLEMELREREQTGIPTLKVGFNNIFGYYLEITRAQLSRVPAHYIRKQTLANAERFITPELKEFETKVLGAEERALRLESTLIEALCTEILKMSTSLQEISLAVGELDVALGLAEVAERQRFCKPKVDDSDTLMIREGRHPVLEAVLAAGTLVPNDLQLDNGNRQVIILTGPNMSGKSTYLRQTALIVILAQIGSFVPASEAHIGVIDQLFTRIGASDRLVEGESTFMVEMVETAHILNHATHRSLVILDEVGRGTSTYDGISIAWACVEYLHGPQGPKVLFATHYFELTELSEKLPGVKNAHVTAQEWGDHVVFLHKVAPGPADRAYGIHVAKLAGVPQTILTRAQTLLQTLEQNAQRVSPQVNTQEPKLGDRVPSDPRKEQFRAWLEEIDKININGLTPLQALNQLQQWKQQFHKTSKGDTRHETNT